MRGDTEKSMTAVNPNSMLPIEMYLIDEVNNNLTGKKGLALFNSILKKNKNMIKIKIPMKFFSTKDRFILLE